MNTFEEAFADTDRAANAVARSARALLTTAKQVEKAAALGDVSAVRKALDRVFTIFEAVSQDVSNARSAWPFSPPAEEGYLRTEYERELSDAARQVGLHVLRLEHSLAVFPSVVRILPDERAARIDGKKISILRPSKLVEILKKRQLKKPKFGTERFLETLYGAYKILSGRDGFGGVVELAKVYQALTLLPGTSSEYDESEFSRDLFLLDRSGLNATKSGARISLPASTGTKGGRGYSFASPDGEIVTFYGIRFTEAPK